MLKAEKDEVERRIANEREKEAQMLACESAPQEFAYEVPVASGLQGKVMRELICTYSSRKEARKRPR